MKLQSSRRAFGWFAFGKIDPLVRKVSWLAVALGLFGSGNQLQASNILINPGFESNSGGETPIGWTLFGGNAPGGTGFWINSDAYAHSGVNYWKEWGATWTGSGDVAGTYQDKACSPGWVYTADGWFFTLSTDAMGSGNEAWVEVSFRDAADNMLGLYKTELFDSTIGLDTWFHYFVTNACDVVPPYAVTGSVTQLTAPAGTTHVRYQVVHSHYQNAGGSFYFDDANLNQLVGPVPPVIANVYPGYMLMVVPTNGISFSVSSPSSTTIPSTGIHMTVNGLDVSGSLAITGSDTSKNVRYTALVSNMNYSVAIHIVDSQNLTADTSFSFDTLNPPVFLWEAEDFDFTNGLYFNNPQLSATPGPNSYFGTVGTPGVDEYDIGHNGDHLYRPEDQMATTYSGDWNRQKFVNAGLPDYKIGWFDGGEWVNYTRDFPPGQYNVIGRIAGGNPGVATVTLSDVTTPGVTNDLGVFSFTGRGWTTYDYITLTDTNGNLVPVTLTGHQTLRITTGGGADITFFMLVPAVLDLPVLNSVYPDGAHPFEPTNTLAFSVTSPNAAIDPSGIHVQLNGNDVSGSLTIAGSPTSRTVSFPGLVANVMYTSVITVTNVNGRGLAVTNHFDTFSESNFMVEAEDFDFDGGQFIDNSGPGDYVGKAGISLVDYAHTNVIGGEQFAYRAGLPNQASSDYLRRAFATLGVTDYNLGWFAWPDWGNYTRTYPTGTFLVYGRFAGSGGYSMYLEKVTSGGGTPNQTTTRLGRWGFVGRGWQAYDWVPLTDEGLAAPVLLHLNGLATLRILTTGNCNPNYFMLVPTSPITVSAAKSGANIVLSFPTQTGLNYRVFYRDDLTNGNWTLLTTVPGDGTTKSVTDAAGAAKRFYEVVAP